MMEKETNTHIERIVSHFHENDDNSDAIDAELENSNDYKEIEEIYKSRNYVSFLYKQKSENDTWRKISLRITPRRLFPIWLKYVAIIILSFSAGSLAIFFTGVNSVNKNRTTLGSITCPKGQITSLTLFDGTTVWLNSESTIKYSSDFNTNNREVYVDGEAYFEVTPNKKVPFIVNLKESKVQVYGTCFNVKSYQNSNVEVVLKEGKVEFITNSGSTILKPNEEVIFSPKNGTFTKSLVNVEKILGWKDGKYFYNKEKLGNIIQQLQRWYGVEIIIKNEKLAGYRFTGVIDHQKSIGYNLNTIEMTNKIKIEYSNDKIIITER